MEDQAEQVALQPLISATHNPHSHANVSQYPPSQPQYQPPPDASQYPGSQSPPIGLRYVPIAPPPMGPQYHQQSTTPSHYQPTQYEAASRALPMDPRLQSYNGTPAAADTPSNALSTLEPEPDGVEAMTTQEALRMFAPQQKIRDKIIADFKKGLSPEDLATKHGVALSTVHVVIKRFQQAESMTLSKSTRWRRKKKADAEEAARKADQRGGEDGGGPGVVHMCGEADFVKMTNQGACVTCTVKFQNVALGKTDTSGKKVKRSRTQFGCRNCRVHLCRKGYCWDVFHKHAKGA